MSSKHILCTGLAAYLVAGVLASADTAEARALVEKGNTFYRMGLYEEAGKHYLRAETIAGDSPVVVYNLGNIYHQKLIEKSNAGDLPSPGDAQEEWLNKAIEAYKRALHSSSPTLCARALYNLGNTYAAARKVDEAILSYREALRLLPEDQDAKHNLELLLQIKNSLSHPLSIPAPPPPTGLTNQIATKGSPLPGFGGTNGVRRTKAGSQGSGSGAKDRVGSGQAQALGAWARGYELTVGDEDTLGSQAVTAVDDPAKSASGLEAAPPRLTRDGKRLSHVADRTLDRASKLEGAPMSVPKDADDPVIPPQVKDW